MNTNNIINLIVKECKEHEDCNFTFTLICVVNLHDTFHELLYKLRKKFLYLWEDKRPPLEYLNETKDFYRAVIKNAEIYLLHDDCKNINGLNPDLLIIEEGHYKNFKMVESLKNKTKNIKYLTWIPDWSLY